MNRLFPLLRSAAALALLAGLFPGLAQGQADKARSELIAVGALRPPGVTAATVAGKPIDSSEVNRLIKQTLRGRPASKAAIPGLEAQALEQVINRRLVQLFLDDKKVTVTDAEIDQALAERQKALRKRDSDLAIARGEVELTEAAYRDEIAWEMRWAKYLQGVLTDDVLSKYFDAHHQEYDGTELRVSHIVLRPDGALDPEEIDSLTAKAERIRDEIIGELTTFEDAALKYSSGPSRQKGGDIGFISRHGLMPEDFSQAAFALQKGEISKPVLTHLGLHLIKCTDVRPGDKTWRDVRREIQPAVMQAAFSQLAAQMRGSTEIEFTGDVAHLNAEGELVKAAGDNDSATATKEEAK